MPWSDGLTAWTQGNTAFISVAFSWKVREARNLALYYRERGLSVRVGGTIFGTEQKPMNRKLLEGLVTWGGNDVDALIHHNKDATKASKGCPGMGTEDDPKPCWFCIVPIVEGTRFTLIPDFVPRPILCDNNLSALPVKFQEHIIRRYKETETPLMDANSGFEPLSFDDGTYNRWKEINLGPWRWAFDMIQEEESAHRMALILKDENSRRKRVYVLIGNEPIASCHERVQKVIEWGCEPYCQAVLPLNAVSRDSFKIIHDWNKQLLKDFMRWTNARTSIWKRVPLLEYNNRLDERPPFRDVKL